MVSPDLEMILLSVAWFVFLGIFVDIEDIILMLSGPDTLIRLVALLPEAVDRAKMLSFFFISGGVE